MKEREKRGEETGERERNRWRHRDSRKAETEIET